MQCDIVTGPDIYNAIEFYLQFLTGTFQPDWENHVPSYDPWDILPRDVK